MKTIHLLKLLEQFPLFTENDVAKISQENPEYIRILLHRLSGRSMIHKIERGKYTVHEDPLIFSSHLFTPSYISLWTALRFYNLTEQLPLTLFVMTSKPKKEICFSKTKIKFIKTRFMWGYKRQRHQDFDIFIADKEKAVIDCLLTRRIPVSEIEKAIESRELDIRKLIYYSKKTKNKSLAKRIGFILESYGYACKGLEKLIDNNYVTLDKGQRKGKRNKKWKIIDNR